MNYLDYYKQRDNIEKGMSANMVKVPEDFAYQNFKSLKGLVDDPNISADSKELCQAVREEYSSMVNRIYNNEQNETDLAIFVSPKFLSAMTKVARNENIVNLMKIHFNKLIFDYIKISQNNDIKITLFNLSKAVNKDIIPVLVSIGVSEDMAANVCIARFSSQTEDITIKRVCSVLMASDQSIMTEILIIKIFNNLFSTHLSSLVSSIMLDTRDINKLTDDAKEIYSRISLALLTIMENIPFEVMQPVLSIYSVNWMECGQPMVRFPIRSIALADYPRLLSCVDSMARTGIVIP